MPSYHSPLQDLVPGIEIGASSPGGATNGTGVDMAGFDGVAFAMSVGVIGNGGTLDLRVVGSANANFSGAVNITNATAVQLPNTQSNVVVVLDVWRPTNRYVRVVATPATNNANIAVTSWKYRGQSRLPTTLPTNHQYVRVAEN